MRQIIPISAEERGFPSLPGCISEGNTLEEAIVDIKDVIRGYIECLEADNLPAPDENYTFSY